MRLHLARAALAAILAAALVLGSGYGVRSAGASVAGEAPSSIERATADHGKVCKGCLAQADQAEKSAMASSCAVPCLAVLLDVRPEAPANPSLAFLVARKIERSGLGAAPNPSPPRASALA
jgi:hypothetical protein